MHRIIQHTFANASVSCTYSTGLDDNGIFMKSFSPNSKVQRERLKVEVAEEAIGHLFGGKVIHQNRFQYNQSD